MWFQLLRQDVNSKDVSLLNCSYKKFSQTHSSSLFRLHLVPYTAQTNIANIASLKLLKLSPLGFHSFNDKASSIMTSYFKLPKGKKSIQENCPKIDTFYKKKWTYLQKPKIWVFRCTKKLTIFKKYVSFQVTRQLTAQTLNKQTTEFILTTNCTGIIHCDEQYSRKLVASSMPDLRGLN